MLVATIGLGVYLSFLGGGSVSAVSGVILSDADTTGYGLNGRDFTVTWTPGVAPSGYQSTYIYITTSTVNLTTTTLGIACNSGVCQPRGMMMSHDASSWTLPDMFTTDSAGDIVSSSRSYVAWVYTSSTVPTIVSSSAVSYAAAFDAPVDTNSPQVDHMSVFSAAAGANASIYTSVFDDQTASSSFGTLADSGPEFIQLVYGADVSAARATSTGSFVSTTGNLYKFLVPVATVGAIGNTFEYYIVVQDAVGNASYICNDFNAVNTVTCQTSPFVVESVSIAEGSIAVVGVITSAGSPLVGATVFSGGFAKAAVVTNGAGVYQLTGLPTSTAFDFVAAKANYCDQSRFETVTTTSRVGINIDLNFGECGFYQDSGDPPMVMFSGPPNGAQYVNLGEKIRVGIGQPLDSNTVNDFNATDAGSNIYLTTDNGTTKIAGQVIYCANNTSAGCDSFLFPGDNNVILFNPASSLTANTFYTLVVGSGVKSASGQSIQGNISGGGHQISFTTGGDTWTVEGDGANFGMGGQNMPPYVRSTVPAPGISIAPNAKLIVEFNEAMSSATVNTTNFTVYDKTTNSSIGLSSVSLDSNENRFVTITPSSLTSGHSYEIRVKGAVASTRGMTMGNLSNSNVNIFFASFQVSGSNDNTAPTIYPSLDNNSFIFPKNKRVNTKAIPVKRPVGNSALK